MLEEILTTFTAQVDGDKDLLAAILRAKEAEELVSCTLTSYSPRANEVIRYSSGSQQWQVYNKP